LIHFQAAHPDWNPTDPSGSIFLSRFTDFNHPTHIPHYQPASPHRYDSAYRRRTRFGGTAGGFQPFDLHRSRQIGDSLFGGRARRGGEFNNLGVSAIAPADTTGGIPAGGAAFASLAGINPGVGVGANPALTHEQRIAERARLYDSAFKRSTGAARRRSGSGGQDGLHALAPPPSTRPAPIQQHVLDEEDLQSELLEEDSYIDGTTRQRDRDEEGPEEGFIERDEDELADGGVMGLLTQIYDNRRRVI
jgi:autophagy-related protein 9